MRFGLGSGWLEKETRTDLGSVWPSTISSEVRHQSLQNNESQQQISCIVRQNNQFKIEHLANRNAYHTQNLLQTVKSYVNDFVMEDIFFQGFKQATNASN